MFNLSTLDLILIAVVVLVLFSGARIPKLVKGITESITEFKKTLSEDKK